ncbi:hypothetical protein ROZALSC1DRAFT_28854 [Rozella allomycis CSF55]|uniref:Ankyrin n=1 Tax=Rozella allomycis (strain CSF55) TaxID=988480 RepID=A0A075AR20_ROZAC|nr:hypothetical protein O9G_001061 [Rozella allomycis CSF55]RKP19569.1 hypothetical protein ROZALSC1DRAFT_28854 [Rozella allomycis CSF55]|eukprot:EPZ31150.1 hypothetical protein O9G_001061 [Rozella allomycis CSF55]
MIKYHETAPIFQVFRYKSVCNVRVDPSAQDNAAIRSSSEHGYLDLFNLLLSDYRVNPSAGNNYAVRSAAKNGHADTVKILLDDFRVNPSDKNNDSIRLAHSNGHVKVVIPTFGRCAPCSNH